MAPAQVTQIYNQTTVINNFNGHGRNLANRGIDPEHITAVTHTPIRPVTIQNAGAPADRGPHSDQLSRDGSTLIVSRPPRNPGIRRKIVPPSRTITGRGCGRIPSGSRRFPSSPPTIHRRATPSASRRNTRRHRSTIIHHRRQIITITAGLTLRGDGNKTNHGAIRITPGRRRPHPLPTRVNPVRPKATTTTRLQLHPPRNRRNIINLHRRPRHRRKRRPDKTKIRAAPATIPAATPATGRATARNIDDLLVGSPNAAALGFAAAFLLLQPRRHWQNRSVGITRRQFEQMQERLGGTSPHPVTPVFTPALRDVPGAQRVILGVDPSLRGTGYGVIRLARPHPVALAHGTITCPPGWERSRCLVKISQTLRDVLREHRPEVCVVEGLFYAQNLQTTMILGEARGAALAAIAEAGAGDF